ncbi:MAG: FxSxx-COOH system tetratricopeptide repeat protein [Ktedonobacteraceae bacterium]
MSTEDTSNAKKSLRRPNTRLKREREQRGWTQSELAERVGSTQVNVSRWEKGVTVPSPYYRQRLGELFGKSIEQLGFITESDKERHEETTVSSGTANDILSSPSLWNVPHRRNFYFTGREGILAHLYNVLRSRKAAALNQAQAISGLGGIGKTQIAIEYAYRYRDYYQAVFWINASSRDALSADFVMLAALLDLPEQQEQKQDVVVRAVKRWLSSQTHWLLILDNVDDLALIADFLPSDAAGDILITTRLQALGAIAQSIEVEKMGLDEGMVFLLRRAKLLAPDLTLDQAMPEQQAQAAEIVAVLDGLPLALDQAGAYLEETRCGLSHYLDLYATHRKELLLRRGRPPVDHPEPVATTWALSFQKVEQESIAAADLLRLLAFLNPEAIPEEIITPGSIAFDPTLDTVTGDPLKVNEAIEVLLRYSLVRRNPEATLLSVHRLVQAVLRDSMDENMQRTWAERAIRAVNNAFPDVELETWERCQRCLPHVLMCASYAEAYALAFPEAARLFNEAASYLLAHAQYEGAKFLLLNALTIREKVLGADNPNTASTLNDLGDAYRAKAEYALAEQCYEKALQIQKQAKGSEHPDVAQVLNNLGSLYRTQGAYTKAEPAYREALRIRERSLETDPLLVAQSYYNLANLYHPQGKYQQAEKLYGQALHIREQQLGDSHPNIATTLSMLAKTYQEEGKLDQAEETNLRALRIRERTSGREHPHVALILNNLIEIYHAEGRMQEAEPLIIRAIKIHEQSLGRKHPYMAYSLANQAEHSFLQGDYAQAENQFKEALAIREQSLGQDHPRSASIYNSLARLYVVQKRYKEAELLYSKTLTIYEQTFGPEHPFVADILNKYASVQRELEKAQ